MNNNNKNEEKLLDINQLLNININKIKKIKIKNIS